MTTDKPNAGGAIGYDDEHGDHWDVDVALWIEDVCQDARHATPADLRAAGYIPASEAAQAAARVAELEGAGAMLYGQVMLWKGSDEWTDMDTRSVEAWQRAIAPVEEGSRGAGEPTDSSPPGQKEEPDERDSARGLRRIRGLRGVEELPGQADAEVGRATREDSAGVAGSSQRRDAHRPDREPSEPVDDEPPVESAKVGDGGECPDCGTRGAHFCRGAVDRVDTWSCSAEQYHAAIGAGYACPECGYAPSEPAGGQGRDWNRLIKIEHASFMNGHRTTTGGSEQTFAQLYDWMIELEKGRRG